MAWTPPTRHLRQDKKLLSDKEFYRKLSTHWGYVDKDATMLFYMGFIQMIGKELREHKFVRLPHIADIAIVTQKGRPACVGRSRVLLGPTEVLKMYPKEKLRRYVRKYITSRN